MNYKKPKTALLIFLKGYFIEAQQYGAVPVFRGVISDGKDGRLKKLSGHVPLLTALRKMGEV